MPAFVPEYVDPSLDYNVFNRLRTRYLIALTSIAVLIITTSTLIKNFQKKQLYDSRIVNVAGRQRMLSQKLSKECLLVYMTRNAEERLALKEKIDSTLDLWVTSHHGLMYGDSVQSLPNWNSVEIDSMFASIEDQFMQMVFSANAITNILNKNPLARHEILEPHLNRILANEPKFLTGMDNIVFQYDYEARQKVNKLMSIELILMCISLLILVFELIFIFTPIGRYIRRIIAELIDSEAIEKKMNKELKRTYRELEQSQNELRDLYYSVDEAIMYARVDLIGKINFISEKFYHYLNMEQPPLGKNIFTLLRSHELSGELLDKILKPVKKGELWSNEVKVMETQLGVSWLMMTIVPVPDERKEIKQIVIVCTDINDRKIAQQKLNKATKERHKKQIEQQKLKAALLLEGQETERRRIAREIHDGIGQLITGLKFQLETMKANASALTPEKIATVSDITANLIKEVRRVSHNLTPTVLSDYGFVTAIETLVKDLNKHTGSEIKFENITKFSGRLRKYIEVNLYRIIQEALTNAVKYSQADNIQVSLAEDNNLIQIIIEDDGIGFDEHEDTPEADIQALTGHGIINMRERARLINAGFFIDTRQGKGTTIKIEVISKI